MKKLTKKEYEEDIIYLFNILKENSPYSHLFNFEKFKNKILKSNIIDKFINNADFYIFLKKFLKEIINKDNGHIFIYLFNKNDNIDNIVNYNIHKNQYLFFKKYFNNCYKKEDLQEDLKVSFLKEDFIEDKKDKNTSKSNKSKISSNDKNLFSVGDNFIKYGIIKNDNNEDVIYIKINSFLTYGHEELDLILNFILGFIYSHKILKDLYIDIRGNGGGSIFFVLYLLQIIYKGKLNPRFNNTKLYYKYTKYNKDFIDDTLNLCKDIKIKELKNNKNFSHCIIQKENKLTFNNKYFYSGFKGHINIIVDKFNYSAAQYFIDITQNNKNFTILGNEKTKGVGLMGYNLCGYPPGYIYMCLPNSKLIIAFEMFYFDVELSKSKPDKPIPNFLLNI